MQNTKRPITVKEIEALFKYLPYSKNPGPAVFISLQGL